MYGPRSPRPLPSKAHHKVDGRGRMSPWYCVAHAYGARGATSGLHTVASRCYLSSPRGALVAAIIVVWHLACAGGAPKDRNTRRAIIKLLNTMLGRCCLLCHRLSVLGSLYHSLNYVARSKRRGDQSVASARWTTFQCTRNGSIEKIHAWLLKLPVARDTACTAQACFK